MHCPPKTGFLEFVLYFLLSFPFLSFFSCILDEILYVDPAESQYQEKTVPGEWLRRMMFVPLETRGAQMWRRLHMRMRSSTSRQVNIRTSYVATRVRACSNGNSDLDRSVRARASLALRSPASVTNIFCSRRTRACGGRVASCDRSRRGSRNPQTKRVAVVFRSRHHQETGSESVPRREETGCPV